MIAAGYHIEENVVAHDECDELIAALSKVTPGRSRAGIRNLMGHESVRRLALDPRLLQLSETVYGRKLIPFKATLFEKTSKANWLVAWHQDTALPIEQFVRSGGWSAPSRKVGRLFAQAPASALEKVVALRIHFDASTRTNGPLRVIPGSHRRGILDDSDIRGLVSSSGQVECLVGRGGLIAISPLLLHASSKIISDEPRRVLHIEYAQSLDITPGVRLAVS